MAKKKNKGQHRREEPAPTIPVPKARSKWPRLAVLSILGLVLAGGAAVLYGRLDRLRSPHYSVGSFKDANVLLITLDTTRADHLSAYGYKFGETPNLARLADTSLVFENAIAHVPLTLPSHTSILTGQLPIGHGVRDNEGYSLDTKAETIAEILKAKGYLTAAFVSAFVLDSRWGLNRGFDVYFDKFNQYREVNRDEVQRRAQETEAAVEEWLPQAKDKRFFCWVHFYDPHEPYDPPEPYSTRFAANRYDGEIAYMDQYIGKLLDKLEALGLSTRTLVVVTGDHGEGLGEHDELTHGMFLYDTTLHVPLFIRLPGGRGARVPAIVRHIDLAPTILALLGFQPAPEMQGTSLIPLINGDETAPRTTYSESLYAQIHYGWSPLRSLTTREYEFIESPRAELFDRNKDPRQDHNLLLERPAVAERMTEQLHEVAEMFARKDLEGPQKMDPDTEAKLRALGYVGSSVQPTAASLKIDPKDKMQVVRDVNEGVAALSRRDYQRALQLVGPVTQSDPNIVDAHYVAGTSYAYMGQYDQALDELFKVVAAKPDHTMALATIGWVYEGKGDLKQAESWYLKVFPYEKDHAFTIAKLANLYRLMNQPKKADEYLARALAPVEASLATTTEPQPRSRLYSIRAEINFGAGRLEEAEADLKAAIALTPTEPVLHFNLAQVYEKKRDVVSAVANYQQETEISPSNFDAQMNLGLLYFSVQRFDAAASCFQSLIRLSPDDPRPALLLAETYMRMNSHLDEALRLTQQGLQQIPDAPEVYALMASIYKKMGRDREAAEAEAKAKPR